MYNGLKWIEREHVIGKVRGCVHRAMLLDEQPKVGRWSARDRDEVMVMADRSRFLPYVGYVTIAMVSLDTVSHSSSAMQSRTSRWHRDSLLPRTRLGARSPWNSRKAAMSAGIA